MTVLYSALKFMRYGERLEAVCQGRRIAPVHIRIKPTNRCNHHCWYCAYRADNLALGGDMDERDAIPADKMMEIADDIVAMGVKAVTFSGGGEPLLYKPLPEVIERLAAGGVSVATLTNGSNLMGRVADALAAHATWVRVSIDAWDDASYQAARGVRDDDFTRMLANMRAFADRGSDCVLGVSFIISRDNAAHVLEACRLFKAAGADHVKLSGCVVGNSGAENNAYHAEHADLVRAQIDEAKALNDDAFTVIDHFHELDERFDKAYTTCPFLNFLTVIAADQVVYTCQDKAYTESGRLGSIKDRSFKDYWFSEDNGAAMAAVDPSRVCGHHCVSHRKNLALLEVLGVDPDHAAFV